MRADLATFLQRVAGVDLRSPAARAIDIVIQAREMRMPKVEPWWRWTVTLAAAITCRRIECIAAGTTQAPDGGSNG